MSHHIATLHMNLPHEKWSKTAPVESLIERQLTAEEMARRKAVDARKEAERLRREAEEAKDSMEVRYRVRQQEKARFTDEQRAWWDSEVIHAKQDDCSGFNENQITIAKIEAHDDLIEKETKAIARREQRMREETEHFFHDLEDEARRKKEGDCYYQRDTSIAMIEAEEEAKRQANARTKKELADAAKKQSEAIATAKYNKFKTGEYERKSTEVARQELEVELALSHMKTEETKAQMFLRDEAARATLAQHKASKSNDKLNWGKKKMVADEDERKAAEKADKKKKDEARKLFHEAQRKKSAEEALVKEKLKRAADERATQDALKAADHAKLEMQHATERAVMAKQDLKRQQGGTSEKTAKTKVRTAHEMKMRSQYGAPPRVGA